MAEQFFLLRFRQGINGGFDLMEGVHVERLTLPKAELQLLRVEEVRRSILREPKSQ
jgi:hypothetical protein